jgi:hypothetical protein
VENKISTWSLSPVRVNAVELVRWMMEVKWVCMYSEDPQSTDELQISSTTSHPKFLAKAMDKLS